jgi:tRNA-dihydrouridine synthase A
MLEPDHVAECLNAMQTNVNVPVTIKCRLGVDHHEDYEFLHDFVNIVQGAGIKHFIIHARNGILKGLSPRQNRHVPPLKYDYIYQLKKNFPNLNITINGGIKTIDECKEHLKLVDGVMIGRAAYENPFLIKDIDTELYGIESNVNSKKSILNQYLDYVEDKLQEGHDLSRMMKHLFGLSRGDKFAKTFRIKILEVIKKESLGQHRKELEDLLIY